MSWPHLVDLHMLLRPRTAALRGASATVRVPDPRASVLECASPLAPWLALTLTACALFFTTVTARAAAPVLRVLRNAPSGTSLLANGGFEQAADGKPIGWRPAPQGFVLAPGEGRNQSQAIRCENTNAAGWVGAAATLTLNRSNALPLRVRGWSKAQEVSGSSDSGYSLYVDLTYTDGTPLWGQTADFRAGTHDWEERQVLILPEKPVRSLTVHCLLRGHSGAAWFDDVSVEELGGQAGAVVFQGVPVQPAGASAKPRGRAVSLETKDGLKLVMRDNRVDSLRVGGRELAASAPSGFLVRDVAADSDFFAFTDGQCPELGLKLAATYRAESNHIVVEGRLSNTRGGDRATTLVFALPIDAAGWRWGDDIRRSRVIGGTGEFANQVGIRCGATGTMSLYPLGTVYDEREGLAVAYDMARPAQCRLAYYAGTKHLVVAYDFGLVPESQRFPGSADFRFVIYRVDPRWSFRAAFGKLIEIFPDYFRVRATEQGLWMPFTDVSTVAGWEDFGFKFHEGNNNVPWDDEHGVLSFRYTEPMTWWMRMTPETPRTMPEALRVRDELAKTSGPGTQRMARVSQGAAMTDAEGQPSLLFREEPWCRGAVWSLNPNPDLPVTAECPVNAATVYWDESTRQKLYGPDARGRLDGEYLDSLEGYVTADLNFRRDHFRYTSVPLTFATDTAQPALFKGFAAFEFTRWISDDVHRLGKLMFANGVPYRFSFLCPWLDVLGTETDWLQGGRYEPAPDARMSLWRTLSGAKPYLLLMNTDYNAFGPELVERYFQRSLFYGMFPGMFSHNAADNPYWQDPKWYNRDRPLFKKYLPVIRRVAEAGWRPVTAARCDNDRIYVERFGPDPKGVVYLTVLNDTATPQEGTLRIEKDLVSPNGFSDAKELVSGASLDPASPWRIRLEPQQAKVIALRTTK